VSVSEPDCTRGRDANPGLRSECHRRVLHQGRVRRIAVGKLHDPLLPIDVEQRLGPGAAQRDAGTDEPLELHPSKPAAQRESQAEAPDSSARAQAREGIRRRLNKAAAGAVRAAQGPRVRP
jgi:hypothetical protein